MVGNEQAQLFLAEAQRAQGFKNWARCSAHSAALRGELFQRLKNEKPADFKILRMTPFLEI